MTKTKAKKDNRNLSITFPERIWKGFVKYRESVEMPTDPQEIELLTPDTYDHTRTRVGRPVSLMSRNKVLFWRMLKLYASKVSGEKGFIVDGKTITCSCGQESREQRNEPTVRRYITTVGPELLEKFKAILEQRAPEIKTQRQARGKSAPSLISAALLTYAAQFDKRPQVFCDTCGNPVGGKFPYADPRLQAQAYLFTPLNDSEVVYLRYGHKKTEILVKRGHLNASYSGVTIAKILGKIEHTKNFTDEELSKALADVDSSYKVKKIFGEGLVQLQSGLYLVSCPCERPSFL